MCAARAANMMALTPFALLLLAQRATSMCNGEDSRCFGSDQTTCATLEAQFICCFWDDGTVQSGYCAGTHSDCSKCAPTKGDCDVLSQCEWVDTTPQCLSSEGEVTTTCSSANSKNTCEANDCCWTARCSPAHRPVAPPPHRPRRHPPSRSARLCAHRAPADIVAAGATATLRRA